jgi:iron complex transport system substrate-binding protein
VNPLDVERGGKTPVDFLRRNVADLESPGSLARTILALEASGVDPRDFGRRNLVTALLETRRANGSYEGWPNSTAFAVMALRSAGATGSLDHTLAWLHKVQNEDGGWGDVIGGGSNADATGAVLQALGADSKASGHGLAYLRKVQRPGGGFPINRSGAINSQTTAWVVQGILAAGANPASFRRGGASAIDFLAAHQEADGHYRYSRGSDQTPVWVTGQVLTAVSGEHFPIPAPAREPEPDLSDTPPSGGVTPAPVTPAPVPAPLPESAPAEPSGPGSAGAGGTPAIPAPAPAPGSGPGIPPLEAGEAQGVDPAAVEPLVPGEPAEPTTTVTEESSTSPAGAAVLGLLAGCLAFAAGWAGRRLFLRRRYGI